MRRALRALAGRLGPGPVAPFMATQADVRAAEKRLREILLRDRPALKLDEWQRVERVATGLAFFACSYRAGELGIGRLRLRGKLHDQAPLIRTYALRLAKALRDLDAVMVDGRVDVAFPFMRAGRWKSLRAQIAEMLAVAEAQAALLHLKQGEHSQGAPLRELAGLVVNALDVVGVEREGAQELVLRAVTEAAGDERRSVRRPLKAARARLRSRRTK